MNGLFMKLCRSLTILVFISHSAFAYADDEIEKTFCTSALHYESSGELKLDLLVNAKKIAVNELFGELISAFTTIHNFTVTEDQITSTSVGLIRVKGNIKYFNSSDFAEVCVSIKAFVTEEDRLKFKPLQIEKKHCESNEKLTTRELIDAVKKKSIVSALVNYDGKLRTLDEAELLPLLHNVKSLKSGFIPETETYCNKVEGTIYPVEILSVSVESIKKKEPDSKPVKQWASRVFSFSNQYDSSGWSASQVIGTPNIFQCGDQSGSWTTNQEGSHFIEVGFNEAVVPHEVLIVENNGVGFVTKLEFIDADGKSHPVEVTDKLTQCPGNSKFYVKDKIDFPTSRIIIHVNANHTATYEEIDAIALIGSPRK